MSAPVLSSAPVKDARRLLPSVPSGSVYRSVTSLADNRRESACSSAEAVGCAGAASAMVLSTYQSYLFYTAQPAQTLQRTTADPTVSRAQTYYAANIGKVKTVDDFVNNYQLFSYAMNSYGLQDFSYGKAFMRKVLTSDLSDPKSFVNQLTDSRYKAFAQAFSFNTKGQLTNNAAVQSSSQASDTLNQYSTAMAATTTSESTYMTSTLSAVHSVDDLTGNKRILSDLLTAYGLSPYTSADTVKAALESDLSDPQSAANQSTVAGLKTMAADFNFDSTGAVKTDASGNQTLQSSAQSNDTLDQFSAARSSTTTTEAAYMQTALASVTSVSGVTGDSRLFADVLNAYGLDPTTSAQSLTADLESDLSDPQSAVNLSGSANLKQLAADFNFDAAGNAATRRVVQTSANTTAMTAAYTAAAGTDSYSKSQATAETTYVSAAIGKATSIDALVNDPRVVSYIGKAYGEPKLSAATLRSVLTSSLSDPKSKANVLGSDYANIAAAFEFTTKGTVGREANQTAQSRSALAATNSAYIEQTIETQAGNDNPGTQLALYFARKAPTITNVYQILADPALLKFAQTLLNLPTSSSSQNIDSQADVLKTKLKPTDLQDPAKVKTFIARFSALYDLANPSADQSGIATLFGTATSS